VRLTFTYKGETREADLVVPGAKMGVPLY